MAKRAKLQTSPRIPVREEKRPVVDSIVPILQQQQQEVVSLASPFDIAQDAFAPEVIAEDSPRNQEPFNIQTFWDTLYQTTAPTVEQTGRLAMNPNDPNFGNLATGRSEQGFEDLVYTPFHEELQAQGIPLYQVDEEGNRLYINLPQGVSSIPQSERSQEFHPELFDRFGNYLEGTWEDVSGGKAGIGEYSRRFVETPDYDFFEDVLSDPRIGLFANLVPGGTLALTGAKAAAGMDASPVEIATSLMQGLDIAGVIEPPSVTALPSGQAGPPVPNAGTGLFGSTYAQTQTALNVAAAGDAEGAALALVGDKLITGGLDAVGLDQTTIENAGIQYDDFQAGVGKVVSEVAGGADLDDALVQGLGKYIREGGTLGSIDLPSVDLGIDLSGLKDVIEPIVETVEDIGRPIVQLVEDAGRPVVEAVEDVARPVGDIVEDVAQGVGDVLSDLDTAVRQALPDIDLPSVDLNLGGLLTGTGAVAIPQLSATRTTDDLFKDELFKFQTEIGVDVEPLEYVDLNAPAENFFEDPILGRSYNF